MINNNHFEELNHLLKEQVNQAERVDDIYVYQYAEFLARIENAIVIVSDLSKGKSRFFTGEFAKRIGIETYSSENSIWEEEILALLPLEGQDEKFISELRFFHYLQRIPKNKRHEFFLMSKLRLKNSIDILHRMYYIYDVEMEKVLYAVCIYSPLIFDFTGKSFIVNSTTGIKDELTSASNDTIISKRQRQILQLIASGKTSMEIAKALNISKNTVSRHRQEILAKLHVRNSIDACGIARSMGII
ncbi:MAG: helix-turn-helix transcriptional regulator [Muribaculaceae bacterium]|nr:helix-turn-helix transcriptional regulator [Muribaculaceae bacterium]